MGKKKKSSSAAAAAASTQEGGAVVATPAAAAAAASSAAPAAAASTPTPAPAVAPVVQPWPSNYSAMKLWPITADASLFRADDSLADKVNRSGEGGSAARRFLFGIYNSKADEAGRRAIAHEAIPEGTLLLRERGQPWVPHAEHADKVCHYCAACIYDPDATPAPAAAAAAAGGAQAAAAVKPPSRHPHCSECDAAFYCSAACQTAHLPVHSLECAALGQSEDMAEVASCNIDLLRAAIRYAVTKTLEAQKQKAEEAPIVEVTETADAATSSSSARAVCDPYEFQSTSADADLLLDHLSNNTATDLNNMRSAASLLLRALPPACSAVVNVDSIVSFLGRVNSNCHGLHLEAHPTIQFGFGLFPLCAIFNHSCYPNSIFINEGANLTFRTIRPVERHEELTVNYIGLYAPRTQRRQELWVEKRFFCMCRRCTLKPKDEDERQHFKMDEVIGALMCTQKAPPGALAAAAAQEKKDGYASVPTVNVAAGKCPGHYRINYQPRDAKAEAEKSRRRKEERAKRRAAAAAAKEAKAAEGKEDGGDDASTATTAAVPSRDADLSSSSDDDESAAALGPEFPLLLRPKVTSARCDKCNHAASIDELWAVQRRALDGSEQLLAAYGTGKHSPQRLKDEFEAFVQEQAPLLHPLHGVHFNLLLPLVNVTGALREHKLKLALCQRVVSMGELCFPRHFLPMCNYYETLANTLITVCKLAVKEATHKKIVQKYKDDAVAVLEKMCASMRVCRGDGHPLTKAANQKLQDAKKIKLTA